MSTITYFWWRNKKHVMWIFPIISSYVEYQEKPISLFSTQKYAVVLIRSPLLSEAPQMFFLFVEKGVRVLARSKCDN